MLVGEDVVAMEIAGGRIEVGAAVGGVVVGEAVLTGVAPHRGVVVGVVLDFVALQITPCRCGVVTEVHVGVEPGKNVDRKGLTEVESRYGELVVAALFHAGHRRAPVAPDVRLAAL